MNGLADIGFRTKRLVLGPKRARRTQVFCIGTAKSGTHSIAAMFSRNVRKGHEKEARDYIDTFFRWQEGKMTEREYRNWLVARDREMALERIELAHAEERFAQDALRPPVAEHVERAVQRGAVQVMRDAGRRGIDALRPRARRHGGSHARDGHRRGQGFHLHC